MPRICVFFFPVKLMEEGNVEKSVICLYDKELRLLYAFNKRTASNKYLSISEVGNVQINVS